MSSPLPGTSPCTAATVACPRTVGLYGASAGAAASASTPTRAAAAPSRARPRTSTSRASSAPDSASTKLTPVEPR